VDHLVKNNNYTFLLMKNLIRLCFLFFLLTTACSSNAQTVRSTKIKQKELGKFIADMEGFQTFEGRLLWARILSVSDGSGSAHRKGTDEVVHSLYICVGQYDEDPACTLFKVRPFNQPKVMKKVDAKSGRSFTLLVQDRFGSKKKLYQMMVSEADVQIKSK
jgi:hypothetical protein